MCNGITQHLGNSPSYLLHVPRQAYICQYSGTRENEDTEQVSPLTPTQMFDVPLKSMLNPELPTITGSGYTLRYTPDGAGSNCTISATAFDLVGGSVVGGSFPSTTGMYTGPSTAGLKGRGDIVLTRTCKFSLSSTPFDSMNVTYITNASVEVTWTT